VLRGPDSRGVAHHERGARSPLSGLRVLELGSLLAGPFVGRMLADFGAEVIKVESPDMGDPLRDWGRHTYKGRTLWWPVQSRNKKLITLDLRRAKGQDLCRQLLTHCDVLVENFRPGTLERWGLGPSDLEKVNPRLVVARISGYGQTGPYAARAGFASVGEAMGGLRHINGYPNLPPPRMGISLGDSVAALFASMGILMALYERDAHSGEGQEVDTSILESCFALLESIVPEYAKLGVSRDASGTVLEHVAPSNIYLTRDGKWMVIAANTENLWRRLCEVINRDDLQSDTRFTNMRERIRNRDALDAIIGSWASERSAAEVDEAMNRAGVACGPVYSVEDIFEDPHYQARNMLLRMQDPDLGEIIGPGLVPKLSKTPGQVKFSGRWPLGANNTEVYGDLLGVSGHDMAELKDAGVI
jgi:succinyl-CoA---D-citramalate CoA-transferase